MTNAAPAPGAIVPTCGRCPEPTPFPDRGAYAAHMVEEHLVSASQALRDARAAFPITEPARTPHAAARPAPAPPVAKEMITVPNRKGVKACSKCGTAGHQANTCGRSGTPKSTRPFQAKDRGQARKAKAAKAGQGGGSASAALRAAIATREREIAALRASLAVLGG